MDELDSPGITDDVGDGDTLASWMCGAKRRGRTERCRAPAMANGRCRIHGGASLRGPASPLFRTGKYSQAFGCKLPKDLRKRFESAMADPELMSLRRYVALYEARVMEALERYAALDGGDFRQRLETSWEAFKRANAKPAATDEEKQAKSAEIVAALSDVERAIADGGEQAAIWTEVDAAIRARLDATKQEQRRLIDMQQMLSVDQAMEILLTLNDILRSRLKNHPKVLSIVANDIEQRLGLTGPALGSGE